MISVMEKKSQESVQGDNYLPRKYRDWDKRGRPKEKKRVEQEETVLPDDLADLVRDIKDEDMQEIAGILILFCLFL